MQPSQAVSHGQGQPPAAPSAGRLSLRRNFSWTFLGNGIYSASNWAMLVVLAKLGTPVMVGQYALGLAVAQPVMMFSQLHLRTLQATDVRRQYRFGDYLGLRLLTTALAIAAIAALARTGHYTRDTALVILVSGISIGFDSFSDIFYGLFQQHERMDRIAISIMLKGPLSLVGLAVGVYLTGGVLWGAIGSALASAVVLCSYDIVNGIRALRAETAEERREEPSGPVWRPRWRLRTLGSLVWLALPMGLTSLLVTLQPNVPRFFIEHRLGEHALGLFAVTASLTGLGRTILSALGQSATPRLAQNYASGRREAFCRLLWQLVAIASLLGGASVLVGAVCGRQFLSAFYTPEYAKQLEVFLWLLAAGGVNYVATFLGVGLTAARSFHIQLFLSALTTGVAFLTGWWLIPGGGLRGAGISVLLTTLFQLAVYGVIVVKMLNGWRGSGAAKKNTEAGR
jgi:O-antigen/teichoic acid export membrane protein